MWDTGSAWVSKKNYAKICKNVKKHLNDDQDELYITVFYRDQPKQAPASLKVIPL